MDHPIILYDGHCALCNVWVRWVMRHDPEGLFHFAPIQSDFARALLKRHGLDVRGIDTVVVIQAEKVFIRSDAPLAIVSRLSGPWKLLRYGRFIPRFLRDGVYDKVAHNRFHWSQPLADCPLPPAEFRDRFHA